MDGIYPVIFKLDNTGKIVYYKELDPPDRYSLRFVVQSKL